jgi:tRNA modification GTPase
MQDNTIAAISTPSGEGAIGVVRISGSNAFLVAEKVFKSFSGKTVAEIKGYIALYGEVYDGENRIDNAVLLKFCAPKSYTGEDVVEISVHGGSFVVNRVLRA